MELSSLRVFILDYDMTLVDTLLDFFDTLNTARKIYGYDPIPLKLFIKAFSDDRLGEVVVPEGVDPDDFWRVFRRACETRYGRPLTGARYLLGILRTTHRCKVVIVTGREVPEEKIWNELARFGLEWGVDEVYTLYTLWRLGGSEEYLFDKSWILRFILRKYAVNPCEAVMVGDYWLDALSCSKVGIPFIGFTKDKRRRRMLEEKGVSVIVDNLADVLFAINDIDC